MARSADLQVRAVSGIGSRGSVVRHETIVEVLAGFVLAAAIVVAVTAAGGRLDGPLAIALPVALIAVVVLVLNPRIEWSLAAVLLYLGLIDGYFKLRSGSSMATAGRDLLLYGTVLGVLIRAAIQQQRLRLPRYSLHLLVFVALVLVQGLNPDTVGLRGALGGYRQHLEFVPLFVLGYMVLASERPLQWLLVGLLVVTGINAIVAVIQYTLTPDQLARWGPGYRDRVLGLGDFAGAPRVFATAGGVEHVRPFGLGADFGASGVLGYLAISASLALFGVVTSMRSRVLAAVGLAGCVIGVVASQSRGSVLLAGFAVLFFVLVTVTPQTVWRTTAIVLGGGVVVAVALSVFVHSHNASSFDRLRSISLGKVQGTVDADRGASIGLVGDYSLRYPLGDGIGRVGPAGGFGGGIASTANAETEFNFLIVETGTVGMLTLLALWVRALVDGIRLVRRGRDLRERYLHAALVSAVATMTVAWFVGAVTAGTPTAPMFWLALGCFSAAMERPARAEEAQLPGSAAI